MTQPTNESEAYLTTLAQKAFLHLWTHPNVFIQKGGNKELCDLLLIFGDDVVIFSDKDSILVEADDLRKAWQRWYRRAVLSSARQIAGAERCLRRGEALYRDRTCTEVLHVAMPSQPRFHRVLTVRGAAAAARSEWAGNGSLVVTNRSLESCSDAPFRLGAFDDDGRFHHVFDQHALDAVLLTLDTAADFLDYLKKRERFLSSGREIIARSEEDLLGAFLFSFREETNERDFEEQTGDFSIVDGAHWDRWLASDQRAARDRANKISYAWDELIETFAHHTMNGTSHYATSPVVSEQEPLLRWFAGTSRLRRRVLASVLMDMVRTTPRGKRRRRYLQPTDEGDPYWVFLVVSQPTGADETGYREVRQFMLHELLAVVKYLHPDAQDVVGLAVGEHLDGGYTEDAAVLDARTWSDAENEAARRLHEEDGIFKRPTMMGGTDYEYPI